MIVGMPLYAQIREAYTSGESQRTIAKRLGVSRQTVKKYCEGATMPGVRKKVSACSECCYSRDRTIYPYVFGHRQKRGTAKAGAYGKADI